MTFGFRILWCLLATLGLVTNQSVFSQDTNTQRVDQAGDPLPAGALVRMGSQRFCSPEGVMEFFLSEDEQTLVSFGRYIIGWDVPTGKELWRSPAVYLPTSYGMRPITPARDGIHFLMAGPGAVSALTRWNSRDGTMELTEVPIELGKRPVGLGSGGRAVDVSPDAKQYFVGTSTGFTVYDESGNELYKVEQVPPPMNLNGPDRLRFGGAYSYGRFSPDGKLLAVTATDHPQTIKLYATADGKLTGEIKCSDNVVRLEFRPDGKQLAATERDTAIRLYDVESRELVWAHSPEVDKRSENYTSALTFSPDGKRLVVCERNQSIYVMNVETGTEIGTIKDHSWNPWAVVVSKDNDTLFSSGWGGTIHQWSLETLKPLPLPVGRRGTSVTAISNAGDRCATVDQQGVVHLIATENGNDIASLTVPNGSFEVLEFSRDGTRLAGGGSWEGKVHIVLWDLESQLIQKQWAWDIGKDPVTGVEEIRFSRDDRKLAVAVFRQDAAYLIDLTSGKRKQLKHRDVYGLSFTSDDSQLLTAGWDKTFRRWDTSTGDSLGQMEIPSLDPNTDTRMYTVCCDPFGAQIATALLGSQIRICTEDDFSLVRRWNPGAGFSFGSLRYSPDGLWLASGDTMGKVCLWDPSTGEKLHEIQAHEDHVYVVGFGNGNKRLCSGGANLGYVWDLHPRDSEFVSVEVAVATLLSGSPQDAYLAWWFLTDQGDRAIAPLLDQLDSVQKVTDIDGQMARSDPSQRERREKLLRQALAKDPAAISMSAARRAISVLSHIATPKSIESLHRIAAGSSDLRKIAAWELKRRGSDRDRR